MKYSLHFLIGLMLTIHPLIVRPMPGSIAQNDSIIYVWDFSVSDASIRELANMLTNDFETELINSGLYTVLERRRYSRVLAHRNMENKITEIQNLPAISMDSLRANKAEVVIFGEVKDDINSGQYEVSVTFQNLSEVILRKGSILIGRGLIADNQTRKNSMKALMGILHAKELLAAKRKQYDLISNILSSYMVRVKDVQKEFKDIARFALEDKSYFDELVKTIFDYNNIFNDLNSNGARYIMDFTREWGEGRGRELEEIISGIMNDIHRTHILKLDKVRIAIYEYREGPLSKSEKKRRKDEILKNMNDPTDDLKRQIDIMDIKINTFLSHLNLEMSG